MIDDNFSKALESLIPRSLDDIIRLNRDQLKVRQATEEEIMKLHGAIDARSIKMALENWRLISMGNVTKTYLFLLGAKPDGYPRITSVVRKIDLDRELVLTDSGSVYELLKAGSGEPPFEHLCLICANLHNLGVGEYFGVTQFFY